MKKHTVTYIHWRDIHSKIMEELISMKGEDYTNTPKYRQRVWSLFTTIYFPTRRTIVKVFLDVEEQRVENSWLDYFKGREFALHFVKSLFVVWRKYNLNDVHIKFDW